MENWRAVVGYEGLYEVSAEGSVRRVAGPDARGWMRQQRALRPAPNGSGYLSVSLCRNGKMHTDRVHSIVAYAFLGARPSGYEVNHKNGCRTDNVASNLEYVTKVDNQRHARDNRLHARGLRNPRTILTDEDVRAVCALRRSGVSRSDVARRFGISHPDYITRLTSGRARTDAFAANLPPE